ncbi:MAG: hypothetical protein IPM39_27895 [Chloroflexi bacterium]|nr:hypothetical protein [Chloroflexota bacterium]
MYFGIRLRHFRIEGLSIIPKMPYEIEFGLIWASEIIILHPDGSSLYAYDPPGAGIATGTWAYKSQIQEVSFTNFRWITATFQPPNRIWATQYITHAGFDVGLECGRQ